MRYIRVICSKETTDKSCVNLLYFPISSKVWILKGPKNTNLKKQTSSIAILLHENAIDAIGMDAAIDLVKLSHSQLLTIIGIDKDNFQDTVISPLTDVRKLLIFGGSILYLTRMTYGKLLGRKSSKKEQSWVKSLGEGSIHNEQKKKDKETTFHIKDEMVESARKDSKLRITLYSNGLTLPSL